MHALTWIGWSATLCFMGDFFDRGSDGVGCIDLIMRLQREAESAGGRVVALLGNHEVLLLAAKRFQDHGSTSMGGTFWEAWLQNGGKLTDLDSAYRCTYRVALQLTSHAENW